MSDIDWDLLLRYQGGDCTPAERARFEQWLAADPRHRALLDATRHAAGRVLERAPVRPMALRRLPDRRPTPRAWRRWGAMAAAAVLLAAVGARAWRAIVPAHAPAPGSEAAWRVVTTARGERATLRLRDGSTVVLGAGSTLRYPAGDYPREVALEGEAFFTIAPDARRPFRVRAGGAVAEQIGTAFGVRAFPGDSAVRVAVKEGKVALGAAAGTARGAVLTPGQLGTVRRGDDVTAVAIVNVDVWLAWLDGRLVFDETPLPEALHEIERWHDVEFRLADPALAERALTATFAHERLDEVLRVLGAALDARVEREGRVIELRPRRR
jgi:transmembrane sensor